MKVKHLIRYLKELPQDRDVYIEYLEDNQSYLENDIYLYPDDEGDIIISTEKKIKEKIMLDFNRKEKIKEKIMLYLNRKEKQCKFTKENF